MTILQILPELQVGGVETGTVDLAGYLVRNGHRSVIVSNGGALVENLVAEGSRHYKLPVHKKNMWTMGKMVKELKKIIIDEGVDIVHARSRVPGWSGCLSPCRAHHTSSTERRRAEVRGSRDLLGPPAERS